MPFDRYYVNQLLEKSSVVKIENTEFHHLKKVMRKKENDTIELIDGKGILATATLQKINSKNAVAKIKSVKKAKPEKQKTVLVQSIIKLNRLEILIEKASELGCTEFLFFQAKNSEKINFSNNKIKRLENIIISACKQCGRLFIPKMTFFKSIKDFSHIKGNIFYGDQYAKKNSFSLNTDSDSYFFIGPEMGFSKEETLFLQQLKAKNICLNKNILRSETAGITAIGIMRYLL